MAKTTRSNILLIGSNERAGLEICRSLGRAGNCISILRLLDERTPADHSRYCARSLCIGSVMPSVSEFVVRLTDFVKAGDYEYLIPVDALAYEVAYSRYDALSAFTRVVGPSPDSYARARNQFAALGVAEASGFVTPSTFLVKRESRPAFSTFPCVVRPSFSAAVIDDEPQFFSARQVRSDDELDSKLRDDLPRVDVMLQSPINGADVGLSVCALNGQVLAAVVETPVDGTDRKGHSSYTRTRELSGESLSIIKNVVHGLSWTGFMTIRAKEVERRLHFVELEPWPSDSVSLASFAGADFPKLLMDALRNGLRPPVFPMKTVYTRHLRMDVAGMLRRLKHGQGFKSALPWIASFRRVFLGQERFEVERLQDPMPGIRQFDRDLKMPIAELGLRFSRTYRQSIRGRFDRHSMTVTSSLLIVCKGNINRSLVAEQLLKIRGFTRVRSAGLLNMSGRRPSRFAETFLGKTVGVDASGCKSQSIERAMKESERIDFVFCFERTQILEISRRFPQLRGKVFLFSSIGPGPLRSQEIADPHGRTPEAYLACFQTIENIVNQLPHADPVQQSTHSNIEVGLSERESY